MEINDKIDKLVNEVIGHEAPSTIDYLKDELHKIFNEKYTKRELDFSYLMGVFNTSGIDGLHKETERLKELGKEPHDIINMLRQ